MPTCTEAERKYLDNWGVQARDAVLLERVTPEFVAEGIQLYKNLLAAEAAWNRFWKKCPIPSNGGKDSAWGKLWYQIKEGAKAEKQERARTEEPPYVMAKEYYYGK